jgi:lysine 2,3-aminomutase
VVVAEHLFPERVSKFLAAKLGDLRAKHGDTSPQYLGLSRQYLRAAQEDDPGPELNLKHYEAEYSECHETSRGHSGMERLYRRSIVIETTMACAAHCRHCLRSNYPRYTLTEKQLIDIAKHCGNDEVGRAVTEVLITGGDPLLIPRRLETLLDALIEYAPNVRIVRIATRLPSQDPERCDHDALQVFRNRPSFRFELATQINHPVELSFPETTHVFGQFRAMGVKVYAQNVLLRGVNDDLPTLVDLYDALRQCDIEAHYLFHCVPLRGTHHLRTSVDTGLRLASALTSCGYISGRAKPMYAAMTDIGKITFYQGTLIERRDRWLLLQSHYRLSDRLAWNPSWRLPATAEVSDDGCLSVWYLDGED